jgi:hypothetical protein
VHHCWRQGGVSALERRKLPLPNGERGGVRGKKINSLRVTQIMCLKIGDAETQRKGIPPHLSPLPQGERKEKARILSLEISGRERKGKRRKNSPPPPIKME